MKDLVSATGLFNLIFGDQSWSEQRIFTYSIENLGCERKKVSVAVDWRNLKESYFRNRQVDSKNKNKNIYIPLCVLDEDLVAFDLALGNESISIVSETKSRELHADIFEYYIEQNISNEALLSEAMRKYINTAMLDEQLSFQEFYSKIPGFAIRDLISENYDEVRLIYSVLHESRLLIAQTSSIEKLNIIKFSYLVKDTFGAGKIQTLKSKLAIEPVTTFFEISLNQVLAPDMINISTPEGTKLSAVPFVTIQESQPGKNQSTVNENKNQILDLVPMEGVTSIIDGHASVSLHKLNSKATNSEASNKLVHIILFPQVTMSSPAFPVAALIIASLSLCMLLMACASYFDILMKVGLGYHGEYVEDSAPAITLLGVIPSLASFYIATPNEHRLSSQILSYLRFILAMSGVLMLLLTFSYAVGIRDIALYIFLGLATIANILVLYISIYAIKNIYESQ